jgi:hypothetical protein
MNKKTTIEVEIIKMKMLNDLKQLRRFYDISIILQKTSAKNHETV